MKITLAFEKEPKEFSMVAWLIKKITNSDYFHCEVIINQEWISSLPSKGVEIKPLKPLKARYDYVNVVVSKKHIFAAKKFIKEQEGKKYDFSGVLWAQFFNISRMQEQNKYFCSELAACILKKFKVEVPNKCAYYSPEKLFRLVKSF